MNILRYNSFLGESLKSDKEHIEEFKKMSDDIENVIEVTYPNEDFNIKNVRFDLITKRIVGINTTSSNNFYVLQSNISNADLLPLKNNYILDCKLITLIIKVPMNYGLSDIQHILKNKFKRLFAINPDIIAFWSKNITYTNSYDREINIAFMINPLKKLDENTSVSNDALIIVDVQKSFSKFYTKNYLAAVNKYAGTFKSVYQIFDNHFDGKNPDLDYLYQENPNIENKNDLYKFNNEIDLIEKRYIYNVNVDFFKKILDEKTYQSIKQQEKLNQLKVGNIYNTNQGTIIVYIGNNHKWMHLGKKLISLFRDIKGRNITMIGGSDKECLQDLFVSAKAFGLNINLNYDYIYSASNCPIK